MSTLKPYFWKQTDTRWAKKSYGGMTLGAGGCGPTDCANVISPLTGVEFTPADAWDWMKRHGYLYPGRGTAWDGITACLKAHKITKFKVTYYPSEAKKALKKGQWVMTVVGPSIWTSGGHYICLYALRSNNKISVSDPYSSSDRLQKNATFNEYARAQKCSWVCIDPDDYADIRKKNKGEGKTTKEILYVKNAKANIRKGRGTKYNAVAQVKRGTKLTVGEIKGSWYKILLGKYKGYFIHKNQLTNIEPYKRTFKALYKMNVRKGYTSKADILGTVNKGTKLVSSRRIGDWVYFPAVKGWIRYKSGDGKTKYMKEV